ncbi:MAG: hypothetical protein WC546_04685 [Candidatus Omnitrophota bacterium]
MFRFKLSWLCVLLGHRFAIVKDLRLTINRQRVVYRCLRCNHPLIERQVERRKIERRNIERRHIPRSYDDRRNNERRKIYDPHHNTPHLLHG